MSRFVAVLRIVFSRSMGNRRLLATVVVGVTLAAALMASVAIYSDAIRDLGLKHALATEDKLGLDIEVLSSSQPIEASLYNDRVEKTTSLMRRDAGEVLSEIVRYGRTDTFFLTQPGAAVDPEDDLRPRAHFQFYAGLYDHVTVTEGSRPGPPPDSLAGRPPTLEVMLGAAAAEALGVAIGDTWDLHPFWRLDTEPVQVTLVGFIEPNDPQEEFWFGTGEEGRFIVSTTSWPTFAFFVDEAAVTGPLVSYLPDIKGSFWTYGLVDITAINSRNADSIETQVRALVADLRAGVQRTTVNTDLPETIAVFQEKLFFTRLPLFALMVQIVGIVLYYLVMVSNMLVERQVGEIALLRSRGASTRQVMGVYAIEGIGLCAIGVLVGPLLAGTAISLLGTTPAFNDLSGGSTLSVNYSSWAFGFALVGVLLALVALLIPAYRATRQSIVHYKQNVARPPTQPAFLRYYLDLAMIVVAAFAFYQLRQRGSLVTDRLFGDLSADPLLLVTPTLFMLMIALVFLRLFPLVLRFASWAGRGLNGATIPLGLFHLVRSPLHYSRLILLLLLATAVGMFAAGFRATLEKSYEDRAAYEAGAPGRVVQSRAEFSPELFRSSMEARLGTENLTPVARITASYSDIQTFTFLSATLLGVVPSEFQEIAYWRGDFAGSSLEGLMDRLKPPEDEDEQAPTVGVIPPDVQYAGLWAQVPEALLNADTRLGFRVADADGVFWDYLLLPAGELDAAGWQFYFADLGDPILSDASPDLAGGLQLDAVYLRMSSLANTVTPHVVLMDEFVVSTAAPPEEEAGFANPTTVESFADISAYVTITGISTRRDPAVVSRVEGGRGDEFALQMEFAIIDQGLQLFGFRPRSGAETLPVIASRGFMEGGGFETGDDALLYINRQYVAVTFVGVVDYFPSWDPTQREELLVANLDTLQAIAARVPLLASGAYPREAWIGDVTGLDLSPEALQIGPGAAPGVILTEALRQEAASDPLIAASWEGILFISFASVLLLTALGFVVYSFLTAQARSLEFAILRTMGFSTRQIFGLVSFEQLFVIVAGVLVGTLLGMPLSGLMIDFMGVTEHGEEVVPPIVTEISWSTVLTVYSLLAVVFVATIIALALLYSRLSVHRALRMGEL